MIDTNLYLNKIKNLLDTASRVEIDRAALALYECYLNGNSVFVCGNGGSFNNAQHFAEDLLKEPTKYNKEMRVMALGSNPGLLTAYSNDLDYKNSFCQELKIWAKPNDLLIAISGSGKSPNVLNAVWWANDNKMKVIGFTGFSGGTLIVRSDIKIHVPFDDMGMVESLHLTLFHLILDKYKVMQ